MEKKKKSYLKKIIIRKDLDRQNNLFLYQKFIKWKQLKLNVFLYWKHLNKHIQAWKVS